MTADLGASVVGDVATERRYMMTYMLRTTSILKSRCFVHSDLQASSNITV